MTMTNEEILRDYRQAAQPAKKAAKNDTAAESRDDTAAKAATTCSENREPGRDISKLRGEALRVIRELLESEMDTQTIYDRAYGVILLEKRLEGK